MTMDSINEINGSSQKNSPQKETNIKAAVLPSAAALFVKE